MWFVYRVSIQDDRDLPVDPVKTRESEVQIIMPRPHVVHSSEVSVRVKTHFHNTKFLKSKKVPAKTMVRNLYVFCCKIYTIGTLIFAFYDRRQT